jgi:hypothetical protein
MELYKADNNGEMRDKKQNKMIKYTGKKYQNKGQE